MLGHSNRMQERLFHKLGTISAPVDHYHFCPRTDRLNAQSRGAERSEDNGNFIDADHLLNAGHRQVHIDVLIVRDDQFELVPFHPSGFVDLVDSGQRPVAHYASVIGLRAGHRPESAYRVCFLRQGIMRKRKTQNHQKNNE